MKEKILTKTDLDRRISELEIQRKEESALLREQFKITYDSLKPLNLIKRSLMDLTESPELKGDLLNSALSLAAGHLGKKVIIGSTDNPLKQVLGTFLQMGITNLVSKHGPGITDALRGFLQKFISKPVSDERGS